MTHVTDRTARGPVGRLLLLSAAVALALGASLAGPATAFVDEGPDEQDQQTDHAATEEADDAEEQGHDDGEDHHDSGGFVDDDDHSEPAPVGGVDAGLGGSVDTGAGSGLLPGVATTLLALAIAGHLAVARRPVRASA